MYVHAYVCDMFVGEYLVNYNCTILKSKYVHKCVCTWSEKFCAL